MNNKPTPRTDAVMQDPLRDGNDLPELARQLENELSEALRERDEARHKLELCMAANSDVARIAKERDEALQALMKIEDLFIDGTDIYADRENMGIIARNALEETK
jgi:hypothetical protein